jgi:DNA-binding beta-propeller fold protein YncE
MGKSYGLSPDELHYPAGIFIEPKTQILYVADAANNRIQKRYLDGKIVTAAGQANGSAGSTEDKLGSPLDVFADENENIYIADWNNQRIQFWSNNATTGKTLAGNQTRGSALNQFDYPSVILVNSKKNLIVADMQNQRVTQWTFSFDPKISIGTIIAVSH